MKDFIPIGTYVQCSGEILITKLDNLRKLVPSQKFLEGFIVGGTFLKEGIREFINEYGYSFEQTRNVFAYKVVRGFINRPHYVLPEQISYTAVPDKLGTCPFADTGWTEKGRKQQAEIMRGEMWDWPRDKKGRWAKK